MVLRDTSIDSCAAVGDAGIDGGEAHGGAVALTVAGEGTDNITTGLFTTASRPMVGRKVESVAWRPDGAMLATASADRTFKISSVDGETGALTTLATQTGSPAASASTAPAS